MQRYWRGATLLPINILVCRECYDTPNETTRAIVLPADPLPIINPRVEPFLYDESGNSPPYGQPMGLEQNAVMPLNGTVHYGVPISLLSVTASGTQNISVTCSAPHNLATNDQISVEGLLRANGFFSVTVTGAMGFTYQTASNIAAGGLLTGTTRMVTAKVGLPRGATTIVHVGS